MSNSLVGLSFIALLTAGTLRDCANLTRYLKGNI